jgi:hypothetical protein
MRTQGKCRNTTSDAMLENFSIRERLEEEEGKRNT